MTVNMNNSYCSNRLSPNPSEFNLSMHNAFGFHSDKQIANFTKPEGDIEGSRVTNIFLTATVIAGYIPIVGTIVGLARIIFASFLLVQLEKEKKPMNPNDAGMNTLDVVQIRSYLTGHIIRGSVELTSFGIFLLFVDTRVTIRRNI